MGKKRGSAAVIPDPIAAPGITLVKECTTTGTYDIGDTVEYLLTITNTGNEPLVNVVLTDPDVTGLAPAGPYSLPVSGQIVVTGTRVVQASDVPSFTNNATVVGTGEISGLGVDDQDSYSITVNPQAKQTRTTCGKTSVAVLDLIEPTGTSESALAPPFIAPTFKQWSYGGVVVTLNANTVRGAGEQGDHCLQHVEFAPGGTATWDVSGLNSLACGSCGGCSILNWGAQSLDDGVLIESSPAAPVTDIVKTVQTGPTSFTGQGDGTLGDGHVFFEDTFEGDGQFNVMTSPANSGPDNIASCLNRMRLFLGINVTETSCDGGNTWEFTAAVDKDGNNYTQAQVTY